MPEEKILIVGCDMVTAYGKGIDPCWESLLAGETSIDTFDRFDTSSFISEKASLVNGLDTGSEVSLVMQMISGIISGHKDSIPQDSSLLLATINGEIDLLERYVLGKNSQPDAGNLTELLNKVKDISGIKDNAEVVSAACASGNAAVAMAAAKIRAGEADSVLVVACDTVSEFLFSGFSSLLALDGDIARPFDMNRGGLTIGEGAGFVLMMAEKKALEEKRNILGEISGWGLSCDAVHMTGPSKNGSGLALSARIALERSGLSASDIGCISAHGTGTIYNDSMEIAALNKIFRENAVPAYSIKGGTGHTMGAAGILELIISLRSLEEGIVPGTVNLKNPEAVAMPWVSTENQEFTKGSVLSLNAGFGGVNASLVVEKYIKKT